ncbi:MAG: NAD(P)-dependent oxidoreductase [Pseudorhodoplanes sp.]
MSKGTVSVIGLGLMGSAFASTLARAGYAVTAWNRTPRERKDLTDLGIGIAKDLAEALAKSDVVLLIASNYDASKGFLTDCKTLAGKTVIQMTTGMPDEARGLDERVRALGGDYLDAAVKKGPTDVGADRGGIFYSGPTKLFEKWQPMFTLFGGRCMHLGENIAAAKALELATFARSYPWLYGYFEAITIAQHYGIKVADATEMMLSLVSATYRYIDRAIPQIEKDDYPTAEHASVSTHHAALMKAITAANKEGINTPLLDVIARYMEQTIESGLGGSDIAACYRAISQDRKK